MEFRILGPLAAESDEGRVALGGARQRTLLALLLVRRGQVVPSERLIEDLYGSEPPRAAATALRAHLSRLRRALGPSAPILARAGGYVLELEPGALDAERFEQLLERGREQLADGAFEDASATLVDALALWRGPALADVAYEDFAQSEIARLEELRLVAVEERVDADLGAGRHSEVVGELEQLVRDHPLRERLRAQLMLALYRSHRQAEALEAYQEGRRLLAGELGLEPGRPLRDLEQAILRQDPALEPPAARPMAASTEAAVFVGRRRELEELRGCLDEALGGRGRLALVAGEPGIGKSRLAEELAGHARRRGATVLVGRCWEAGGAPAYWPWVQSLRTYLRDCDPGALREQLGPGAADLAQLLPEVRRLVPDVSEPPAPDSEGARFRLFDAMASFLRRAAAARPIVIVLDDLHAADEPSLLLLRFVARELDGTSLLLVGAYRDADPSLRDPLLATLSELAREPRTRRVALTGLAEGDVAEFIARAAGVEPAAATVAEIYAETDGNPLFLGEIVRLLADGEMLERTIGARAIPSTVREVIGSRMSRLSHTCREALELACVLGREFELETLQRLAGWERKPLLDSLDEALSERVIEETSGAPGEFRFAHVLLRDALYHDLNAARRLQLHLEAGQALETVHADELGSHLAEIAQHYSLSAPLGTAAEAIAYARRAGERAISLLAYEEAARLYGRALALSADDDVRCDLLLGLGEAQARAGETAASRRSYREAAELAGARGLSDRLAQAALGYGGRIIWDVMRDDAYVVPLLERALEAIGEEETPTRVQLLARLAGGPLRDHRFPPARKREVSREALEMGRRIGDPPTLAYALAGYIEANLSPDNVHEQLELAAELIQVALAAGEPERAIEGHEERLLNLLSLGDRRGAEDELAAMTTLAETLRQPTQDWLVVVYRVVFALLDGDLVLAEELISTAHALGERAQSWNADASSGLQLYLLRRAQGRLAEVEGLIRESAERFATYTVWRCVLAQTAATLGHETEARRTLDELSADDFSALDLDEQWLVSMTLLADAATDLGDLVRAGALYDRLLPYAQRIAVCYPEISTGPVARSLGILADAMGRGEEACRHFETALQAAERIGARPWLALTRRDYAAMLRARGEPGDERRADELTRDAKELADSIGMRLP